MASPAPDLAEPSPDDAASLLDRYAAVRAQSCALLEPLSAEDACVQSMPDASPAKWHLAHVTWFFETFVLEPNEPGFTPCHPAFRELFNSYYNGVGKQFPRPRRGMITRPSLAEVLDYRRNVDERMARFVPTADAATLALVTLGLEHEQQHQELLLMDIKHLLAQNPLAPVYRTGELPQATAAANGWHAHAGGMVEVGHSGDGFHFDNETPRHRALLEPFRLATRLVTNAEYLEFIEDGGYRQPLLWLADGWSMVAAEGWTAPAYWREQDGAWREFTLHGEQPLSPASPVCHLSYYEADAYAQWAGARLPTEEEFEAVAAAFQAPDHTLVLHPRPALGTGGPEQLGDALWQWTRSAYLPYPGFRAAAGAVGEYNGKFMSSQMTLRGGACITPPGHARPGYRNFFYPHQRWAYTGLRLAEDA